MPDKGKLYVVATPIGNLHDMSERAQTVLSQITWIAAEDTRHSQGLCRHFGFSATLISYHTHNEHARTPQLIEKLLQGENGALISDAGTPLISDPGYLLIAKAYAAGITVVPIPGPCAAITALSVCGLPTDKFFFEGFLPVKAAARKERLKQLAAFPETVIFFEAPHRIAMLLENCVETYGTSRRAFIARELTKQFESTYGATLEEIRGRIENQMIPQKGEFVLVVEGAPEENKGEQVEMEKVLGVLLKDLSVKKAVEVASMLTNFSKNALYTCAVALKQKQ